MRGRRPVKCGKSALQIFSHCVVHATVERAFQTPRWIFLDIDFILALFFTKPSLPYLFFFFSSRDLSFFDIALIISISRSRVSRFFYERLRVMSNRINGLVSQSIRRISLAIRYDITCHRLERSQGELHFSQTWLHSSTFEGRAVGKKVPRGWIFSSESLIPPRNEDWRSS